MIQDRILRIRDNIARVCQKIGRNPAEITLIGVTKYTSVANTQAGIEAGITDIGELKVHDAQEKFIALGDLSQKVTKHMIGHLQTNKVKLAVKLFDLIQTVDSERLSAEIEKQAAKMTRPARVLIEVNCSGEEQKTGLPKDQALRLAEFLSTCEHVELSGLMTMAPYTDDEEVIRGCFRELRLIAEKISKDFVGHPRVQMRHLSMGMSGDYELAIEEGSNMVRIGTAIFGE